MKYIVKNCPACKKRVDEENSRNKLIIETVWIKDFCFEKYALCQDCTDCLVKRVVEKVKRIGEIQQLKNVADEILKEFEVEEVKDVETE